MINRHSTFDIRHSTTAHAAYHDLQRSLLNASISSLRGTPTRVVRNHKTYWYDGYRIGIDVRKTHIGENSGVVDRLKWLKSLRQNSDDQRKQHPLISYDCGGGGKYSNGCILQNVYRGSIDSDAP
ncbi:MULTISPECIES: hypothetical protein [Pacificibacter]|uniref:hypothetical protein n=1 Tax=Pacificibacter TaxID=1042323 RepID=UPI001C089677|nr:MULTISPECIES: hypothetical protein [Pacificibacter]MBU2937154.1 hypothetical protein [Pacificibacter marinus]MDO6617026.1 hypothetical protein [Pacificibacter sp. 1_MG-2023]